MKLITTFGFNIFRSALDTYFALTPPEKLEPGNYIISASIHLYRGEATSLRNAEAMDFSIPFTSDDRKVTCKSDGGHHHRIRFVVAEDRYAALFKFRVAEPGYIHNPIPGNGWRKSTVREDLFLMPEEIASVFYGHELLVTIWKDE